MTIFDVRIPGLKMTVVASDGQNIQPVTVDEFRMGVAETYDVIVEPEVGNAYCLYAQNIDRTGFVAGSLTSDASLVAAIPDMDPAPILGHGDMGMDHGAMDHGAMNHGAMNHGGVAALGLAGHGSQAEIKHVKTEFGPHVDMRAEMPQDGLHDPGIGLREHQALYSRKVLTYADIRSEEHTSELQ